MRTRSVVTLATGAIMLSMVLLLAIIASLGSSASATPTTTGYGDSLKTGTVPDAYVPWIEKAAGACDIPQLTSPLIAAQLDQESGFNPNAYSSAGAEGIAQFEPGTFTTWAKDDDGTGHITPYNPSDAIMAEGRMMCDLLHKAKTSGYPGDITSLALAGYNAGWGAVQNAHGIPAIAQTTAYITAILAKVPYYTAAPAPSSGPTSLPSGFILPSGTPATVATAVSWALAQRGGWYHFGGTCSDPLGSDPNSWCDCSSLMQAAYAHAGIKIDRTTYAQVTEGTAVNPDTPLPGDLVFVPGSDGSASFPGHVGMYLGRGLLLEAPRTGLQTRVVSYASWRNSTDPALHVVAVRRIVQ